MSVVYILAVHTLSFRWFSHSAGTPSALKLPSAIQVMWEPTPAADRTCMPLECFGSHPAARNETLFFDFPTFRHVPGSVIGLATAPVPPPATHTGRRSISAESGGQLVTNSFSWSGLKLKDSNQGFIFANPAGMIQNNSWFSSKFGWKSSLILKNGIKLSIVLHMYNSFFFGKSPFMMVQDFCKRGTIRECNPESNY